MSTYSTLIENPEIKPEFAAEFIALQEETKKVNVDGKGVHKYGFDLEAFSIDDKGLFDVNDAYTSWSHDAIWVPELAHMFQDGDWIWTDDFGEQWGYRIIDGKAYDLEIEIKRELKVGNLLTNTEMVANATDCAEKV
jgi:hypothetical protein